MTNVHTVRPTDLVALVTYDGRVYRNEALTRDRIGTEASPHPLETALEQWFSFATGRHTWISVKGATLRGLVSARRRGSRAAWEVDCLIDAAEDDAGVMTSLLDRLVSDAERDLAEKVFLRVAAGSQVAETACRCGFTPHFREWLLAKTRRETVELGASGGNREPAHDPGLRRWGRADAYGTFRLYNRWTPEAVRRMEGATFREWLAARERVSPASETRQWVTELDGRIAGWLRVATDGDLGRFDLMADPVAPELLEQLVDAALARLRQRSEVYTLVPEYAPGLRQRLQQRGFADRGDFVVLVRQTTRPVRVPKLAPATPAQTSPG